MDTSLPAIFGAGVLSFASPCVLPMVPIYLATLAGVSVSSLTGAPPRGRLLARAAAFSVGLSVPFVILGLAASTVGRAMLTHRAAAALVGGALVILMGLRQLGVLRVSWLERDVRPGLDRVPAGRGLASAALFGAAFGLGWTPCVGPVLGTVLTWTAQSTTTPLQGAVALSAYAAGIAAPLMLVAAFAPVAIRTLRRLARHTQTLERVTGVAMILTGLWIVAQQGLTPSISTPAIAAPRAEAVACAGSTHGCGMPDVAPASTSGEALRGVVEFVRRDCPSCAAMAPRVRSAERRCAVEVRRVVVDDPEGMALARGHGVVGVPTLMTFDARGAEIGRLVGVHPEGAVVDAVGDMLQRPCAR